MSFRVPGMVCFEFLSGPAAKDEGVVLARQLTAVKLYSLLWVSNVQECNST